MVNISLSEKELDVVRRSINHCIETCDKGGADKGCPDCTALRGVLQKLE